MTNASPSCALLSAPQTSAAANSRTNWTVTQLVRLQSPATALILLPFCLGRCQISCHARTTPPVSLHLCSQLVQPPLSKIASVESSKFGSELSNSLLGLEQQHIRSSQQSLVRVQRHPRSRRECRLNTILASASGGCCMAPGRRATHPVLLVQLVRRKYIGLPPKVTGSPSNYTRSPELELGWWEGPAQLLCDWDADLARTALQHRLRIPFLDQDARTLTDSLHRPATTD